MRITKALSGCTAFRIVYVVLILKIILIIGEIYIFKEYLKSKVFD